MPYPGLTTRSTILAKAAGVDHDKILVLNKIDAVPREQLLALAQAANARPKFGRSS